MEEQAKELGKEIEENKWYLSERVGHDVGWEEAESDYLEKHVKRFACQFRCNFLKRRCLYYTDDCELRKELGRDWKRYPDELD